jgi:hypothetical protein
MHGMGLGVASRSIIEPKHPMQKTNRIMASVLTLASCALLSVAFTAQAQEKKIDPTGTYTWTMEGRGGGGGEARKVTLKLKLAGEKLTGTISMPGRQGAEPRETPISEGKVKGDEISFAVTREWGGNTMTQKYTGKLSGDKIKGKIEFQRGGETQSRDWEAERQKSGAAS